MPLDEGKPVIIWAKLQEEKKGFKNFNLRISILPLLFNGERERIFVNIFSKMMVASNIN